MQGVMEVFLSFFFFFSFTEFTETSLFQRVVGLFSFKDEHAVQFTTNDIEMTTFSVVSGQSPNVLPAICCSAARSLVNTPQRRGVIKKTGCYGFQFDVIWTTVNFFLPVVFILISVGITNNGLHLREETKNWRILWVLWSPGQTAHDSRR